MAGEATSASRVGKIVWILADNKADRQRWHVAVVNPRSPPGPPRVSEAFDRISTNMEMFDQGTRGATVAAYERDAMAEEV